jgi:flagellar biosynthesis protein FlhB
MIGYDQKSDYSPYSFLSIVFFSILSFLPVVIVIYFAIVKAVVILTIMDYSFCFPNERIAPNLHAGQIYDQADNSSHEFSDED